MASKILKLNEVLALTRLGRSTLFAMVATRTFPRPIKLSHRSTGWVATEVDEWLRARIEARGQSVREC